MNLTEDDKKLLKELCGNHEVSFEKVIRLLETVHAYELKDRRTGIYDALREIVKSDLNQAGADS